MSYFHPQRMPVLPPRRRKAARLQLEQVVAQSARSGSRVKPTVIAAGIAVIMLSTGAAAIAVAVYQPVTNKSLARCYTVADISGFHTTLAEPSQPGQSGVVRDPRSDCAALFRQGLLRLGSARMHPNANRGVRHYVPRLIVCTMRDGSAAVIPGRDVTCAQLDLPAAARR